MRFRPVRHVAGTGSRLMARRQAFRKPSWHPHRTRPNKSVTMCPGFFVLRVGRVVGNITVVLTKIKEKKKEELVCISDGTVVFLRGGEEVKKK